MQTASVRTGFNASARPAPRAITISGASGAATARRTTLLFLASAVVVRHLVLWTTFWQVSNQGKPRIEYQRKYVSEASTAR